MPVLFRRAALAAALAVGAAASASAEAVPAGAYACEISGTRAALVMEVATTRTEEWEYEHVFSGTLDLRGVRYEVAGRNWSTWTRESGGWSDPGSVSVTFTSGQGTQMSGVLSFEGGVLRIGPPRGAQGATHICRRAA